MIDAPGHVAYKMNPQGRVLMELGSKGVAGMSRNSFNLPTDVAFGPNGKVYVTDGYGNARVVKYTADGQYVLEWGSRGTGPGEFGLPHNLVVDAEGRVYVTDRDNQRVQVFTPEGEFLTEWPDIGGNSALFMTDEQQIWTGGTLRNLEGVAVATLPDGNGGHGMTMTDAGEVFVAQLGGRVQKFVECRSGATVLISLARATRRDSSSSTWARSASSMIAIPVGVSANSAILSIFEVLLRSGSSAGILPFWPTLARVIMTFGFWT